MLEDKPEVKAWTDLITLSGLSKNKMEIERLKQYEIPEPLNKGDKETKL